MTPAGTAATARPSRVYAVAKRAGDVVLAVLLLMILSPVLIACALAVLLTMGRPVLFRQIRPGLRGKQFEILKYRTMTDAHGPDGELLPDEERLTGFGRFLRRTSLDELPELVNVLRGQMSLVGPRPLLLEYLPRYSARHASRHAVRPGVTGWAQVNGRNATSWQRRLDLDVWYVENVSLALDVRILLMTVWKVITGEGIAAENHPTMPEFQGDQSDS